MNGRLAKHFQRRVDGPGFYGQEIGGFVDGIPFLGRAPLMTQAEYDDVALANMFHCETFCTWDPDHMRRYSEIMTNVWNAVFFVKEKKMTEVADKGWQIWLEWTQPYAEADGGVDAVAALTDGRAFDLGVPRDA